MFRRQVVVAGVTQSVQSILRPPFPSTRTRNRRFFGSLFRTLKPFVYSGIKTTGKEAAKALVREALRTGSRILTAIADNPKMGYKYIISKQV
jgi:phage baseplate assembly protein W